MDVGARQVELLEVGAHRLGGKALLAQVRNRCRAVALRELGAVGPDEEAVVEVLGGLGAEGLGDRLVQRRVREVILAADHVRDPELDVVDHVARW